MLAKMEQGVASGSLGRPGSEDINNKFIFI